MDSFRLQAAIASTAQRIIRHQRSDGGFSFCCEANPLPDALMIVLLYGIGRREDPLISELSHRLRTRQNPNGSWTAYADQTDTLSATVLAYFALLLAGYHKADANMHRAREVILSQGGITKVSNLTKIVLAAAGQIPWSAVPSGHIELMSWGTSAPVNVYDFAGFTRLHLVPYMVLSHLQYQFPISNECSLMDLVDSSVHLPTLRIPQLNKRAVDRCHAFLLERVEPNGTWASYLTATVLAIFALRAIGYATNHPRIGQAVLGLKGLVYRHHDTAHQQLFSSTVWDTALCMQALQQVSVPGCGEVLERGAEYLLSKQHTQPSDWTVHNPSARPGGWGFSDVNTLFPDVDDTVAALKALYPFRHHMPKAWKRGAQWVLSMQNRDGGWSAFDKNCNKFWLEYLPINDMGQAMTDPSTADLTGRVLETIGCTQMDAHQAMDDGMRWLLRRQRRNGSWFGRWGIAYIYGTWASVRGLRASGVAPSHPAMSKALAWLEGIQHEDGGFGESCRSDVQGNYVLLEDSTASQTAWALMAMLSSSDGRTDAMDRAANYLVGTVDAGGGWRETYPTGAGVAGQAYLRYHSYAYVWPLMALQEYATRHGTDGKRRFRL